MSAAVALILGGSAVIVAGVLVGMFVPAVALGGVMVVLGITSTVLS